MPTSGPGGGGHGGDDRRQDALRAAAGDLGLHRGQHPVGEDVDREGRHILGDHVVAAREGGLNPGGAHEVQGGAGAGAKAQVAVGTRLVDQADDEKIGVKSSARFFGRYTLWAIALLQLAMLALLEWAGSLAGLGEPFSIALLLTLGCFFYQHRLARQGRDGCFRAFLHNHYVGLIIFVGIVLSLPQ